MKNNNTKVYYTPIQLKLPVDFENIIDGTKVEANANKYTWVWKKSCIKSRNNVYAKLNGFVADLNEDMVVLERAVFETRQEYSVEYVDYILKTYLNAVGMTKEDFVHGSGKRKTVQQKRYEKVEDCLKKLKNYAQKMSTCGDHRNSYSKTDHDATFMRFKKDYMQNDQLNLLHKECALHT